MQRLILPQDYRRGVWKNGQGVSFDIAGEPDEAGWSNVIWRVSIAEISQDLDFSDLSGIDRTFTAIAGRGLTLEPAGRPPMTVQELYQPVSFPGEWRVRCRLHGGPARAFNVMTTKGMARHSVDMLRASTMIERGSLILIHPFIGKAQFGGTEIGEGATLLIATSEPTMLKLTSGSIAAVVRIELEKP